MSLGPLMLDLVGTCLQADEIALLQEPQVGGVIFFSRNFENKDQLQSLVQEIRALRPELLLAVDQEGGRVQRFREGFTRLPAMQSFYPGYCLDPGSSISLVRDCGWLMAAELLACGIDFSFAPVLDVDSDSCAAIADRSFSDDPEVVATLAGAFIEGMHEAGMAATGKHFPGHGAVVGDSHMLLPVDKRPLEEIRCRDYIPFARLVPESLDAVMPAHIVFSQVDEQPVGFSQVWLQQYLRTELGFDGVVFSDDLSMEGASSGGNYAQRATLALQAGCDMVLVCNNRVGALETLNFLKASPVAENPRLSAMTRRQQWQWSSLSTLPRWQETVSRLASLHADKS